MTIEEAKVHRKQGIIPAGITVFHAGITREMVDQPAVQDAVANNVNKEFKRQLVVINNKTEIFAPVGKFDIDVFKKHIDNIEASIKIGTFDFHGQPGKISSNQWQGNNLVAGSVMVEREAIRTLECLYFDFGQFGVFPFQVRSCGNMLDEKLVLAVVNNTAHLVSNASAQNQGPDNTGSDNAGNNAGNNNGGQGGQGGSLTFDQMLALLKAIQQPVVVNAGNNVGNNNGGQGGQGGQGGLVTSQGGPVSPLQPVAPTPHPTTPGYTDPQGNLWTPMPKVELNRAPIAVAPLSNGQQGANPNAVYASAPCTTCPSGSSGNAGNSETNRLLKTANGLGIYNAIINTGDFAVDLAENFGAFDRFRDRSSANNGTPTNTPLGNPADWVNRGRQ